MKLKICLISVFFSFLAAGCLQEKNKEKRIKLKNVIVLVDDDHTTKAVFMDTHPEANKIPEKPDPVEMLIWFCEPRDENANINAKLSKIT